MTEWAVTIDTEADVRGLVDDEERVDALLAAIAPAYGALSIDDMAVSVTLTVGADDLAVAVDGAIAFWTEALRDVGLLPLRHVSVEALTANDLEDRQAVSNMPEIWSTPEVASYLGVSRQRVHQLIAEHSQFPPPLVRLGSGPVWLADSIRAFERSWTRKPGRPAKVTPAIPAVAVVAGAGAARRAVKNSATSGRFVKQAAAKRSPRTRVDDGS